MISDESITKILGKLFNTRINGETVSGTKHPVNFFARPDYIDASVDACYDILADEWVKPPHLTDLSFDPELAFPEAWHQATDYATSWDIELGELRRDLIEYKRFFEAVQIPGVRPYISRKLDAKLSEIESECANMIDQYNALHKLRVDVFSRDPARTRAVWQATANWAPENVVYKLLELWQYNQLLVTLKRIWAQDISTMDKVDDTTDTLL